MITSKCVRCKAEIWLIPGPDGETRFWMAKSEPWESNLLCGETGEHHVPHPLMAANAVNDLIAIRDQLQQPEGPDFGDAENREVKE